MLTDEEQYCHDMIALCRREYEKAIEPYMKRLVEIASLKPAPPIFIPREQADMARLSKKASD